MVDDSVEIVLQNLKNYSGVIEILSLLKEKGEITKSEIIRQTNFSRTVCDKAIAFLQGAGAVENDISLSQTVYKISEKGVKILSKLKEDV